MKGTFELEKKYFSIDLPEDKSLANNCTLLHKFEVCGFNYEANKWDKNLSYRDIEKTLILFQTSFTVKILNFKINIKIIGNFVSGTSGINFAGASEKNGC